MININELDTERVAVDLAAVHVEDGGAGGARGSSTAEEKLHLYEGDIDDLLGLLINRNPLPTLRV